MKPALTLLIVVVCTLVHCSQACADLGDCIVLHRCGGRLGRAGEEIVAKYICDAYSASPDSDSDILFVIEIYGKRPPGAYSLQKVRLVFGETRTVFGYQITAGGIEGIMNAAIEIRKAFEAESGSISRLKEGQRSGLLDEPLYEEQNAKDAQ
jgi:hypothetical protein